MCPWAVYSSYQKPQVALGPRITSDGDFSHDIKRFLCLGQRAMTNLDSILKSKPGFAKGLQILRRDLVTETATRNGLDMSCKCIHTGF